MSNQRARTLSTATVDRASVESILTRNENTATMQPSPMEHIGSPKAHRNTNENEPPMSPLITKPTSRPNSFYGSGKNKANRLSLNFPIVQTPTNHQTNDPMSETPTGTLIPSPVIPNTSSADPPNDFLQELARQERRVLELREELGRAEGELQSLKKKWAYREVHKKKAEIRAVEQMIPYSPKTGGMEDGGNEVRRSTEMTNERRKALLLAGIGRESRRKVMEGRHTRTLSLLSPDRSNFSPSTPGCFSPLIPGSSAGYSRSSDLERGPDTIHGCIPINRSDRSATLPTDHLFKARSRHSYHTTTSNEVLKTGKKLAEDLKAGLWTFVEDLRQATVGEEAVGINRANSQTRRKNANLGGGVSTGFNSLAAHIPQPKKQVGRSSPVAERDYTKDLHELIPSDEVTETSVPQKRRSITAPRRESLEADDWLNWDSPPASVASSPPLGDGGAHDSQRWSSSTFADNLVGDVAGLDTPSKGISIPAGGSKMSGQREREGSIQWPALKPFSPSNLKKTAESLMREWEKSLTPPPEEEDGGEGVGDGERRRVEGFEGQDLLR